MVLFLPLDLPVNLPLPPLFAKCDLSLLPLPPFFIFPLDSLCFSFSVLLSRSSLKICLFTAASMSNLGSLFVIESSTRKLLAFSVSASPVLDSNLRFFPLVFAEASNFLLRSFWNFPRLAVELLATSAAFLKSSDCDTALTSVPGLAVDGTTPREGTFTFFTLARFLNLCNSFLATFSLLDSANFSKGSSSSGALPFTGIIQFFSCSACTFL